MPEQNSNIANVHDTRMATKGKRSAFLMIPHLRAFASLYKSCGQGFKKVLLNHSLDDIDTHESFPFQ